MDDNQTFELLVFLNWRQREVDAAQVRQQDAFVSDAVDSLVSYVESVGDAQINGGWNFS